MGLNDEEDLGWRIKGYICGVKINMRMKKNNYCKKK